MPFLRQKRRSRSHAKAHRFFRREGALEIIGDPQVAGVIGTNCSAAAVAASPVISDAGLVMISPSNTSPRLTSDLAGNANPDYHAGYFRVSSNDLHQARALSDFVYNQLELRSVATVHDGDPYTSALVAAFADEFSALGGNVPAQAEIEKGDTDMREVLEQFAVAGPDAIFFPLFITEGSAFAAQARAFDGLEGTTLISADALLVSAFLETPQSEGIYFAGLFRQRAQLCGVGYGGLQAQLSRSLADALRVPSVGIAKKDGQPHVFLQNRHYLRLGDQFLEGRPRARGVLRQQRAKPPIGLAVQFLDLGKRLEFPPLVLYGDLLNPLRVAVGELTDLRLLFDVSFHEQGQQVGKACQVPDGLLVVARQISDQLFEAGAGSGLQTRHLDDHFRVCRGFQDRLTNRRRVEGYWPEQVQRLGARLRGPPAGCGSRSTPPAPRSRDGGLSRHPRIVQAVIRSATPPNERPGEDILTTITPSPRPAT